MTSELTRSFKAPLEAIGTSLRWVVVRVPIDLKKAWPTWKSRRVFGEINGFAFKTALIPASKGQGHLLIVNQKMQAGAGVRAGDRALIKLSPDLGELVVDIPPEFAKILKSDRALKKFFEAMSPSMRKGFTNFIADAKSKETRQKRAEAMAESLMLAMEGEQEPPPILRVQFQRQPQARRGWDLMTPLQRRNHLLGIFYAQTVDGRERRAAKAIESCVAVARRRPVS
ncbi:YdeI/OmpD-associated family protein [Telmatobacter sp. DSM 110680]|uniref:YdeI/OmpD-associated family protein n=1 Tax=Telmatobacter sp. DSM 110680 TaxID=3036704 RepID=A0AAU7DLN4_9BACT